MPRGLCLARVGFQAFGTRGETQRRAGFPDRSVSADGRADGTEATHGKEAMRDGYRLALGPTRRDHSFVVWAFQTSVRGIEKSFQRRFDRVFRKAPAGKLISEESWDPRLMPA